MNGIIHKPPKMPAFQAHKCDNCLWWKHIYEAPEGSRGECHYNAPTVSFPLTWYDDFCRQWTQNENVK